MVNKPTYQELTKRVKQLETANAELKKETDALRASEMRLKELIKNSSDSIVILNKDGLQTYVSDAVEKHLGFKPHEVLNISVIEEMIHPDDQQKTMAAFAKIIEEGECGVQYRHRHKNGSWVYLEAWGTNQLDNPDIQGVVVNVRNITEWKKAEEALVIERDKAQQYFDIAGVMLICLDRNQNVIQINKKGCEILEYTEDEIIGKNWFDNFLPPKKNTKIQNLFEKYISDEKSGIEYSENPILTKSGNEKIISWHDSIIRDDSGYVISIFISGEDITERKHTQKALQKSEEKFRLLFQTSPNAITLTTIEDGIVVDVNKTFLKMLGYSRKEVIGKSTLAVNIWNDLKDRDLLISGLQKHGLVENLEAEFQLKNGQIISGLMSACILDIENVKYLLASTQDITDKKGTDQAMRLMKYGVDRASDCIFWMNSKADLIYVNNATCHLLGYSHEELLSMNLNQIDTKISLSAWPDRLEQLKQIKSDRFESVQKTRDGRLIPVEVTSSYVLFEEEEGVFSFSRDITERKKAEQEKIKAQKIADEHEKLALVGQIAGKMAHDFNNILAIIMGNTQLSLLDCKEEHTIKTLKLIFNQTIRGKNLTKNLVVFAKDQEPKQEFFRLSEKIDLVFNLLKKDLQGIELIKKDRTRVPELLADPGMIEHALVNLLQNSIHATSMVDQPKIMISVFHKDKKIYLEIEDNGCGIPEEALDRIYEPAFTMKGSSDITGSYQSDIKGTGYGMANVKKYIEQHMGSILIDSKTGDGTKITISFPVIKKELTQKEIKEIQKKDFYFKKYILLVEDEQPISDVQYKILTHEPCNHKVDVAATFQMAIDLFDRNKYDFVSLDYILPGERNGMDVYRHIRQINDTVPILFVSGNLDFLESIKELKYQDPYVDHVSKPCQNKDYVNAINDLLEKA